MMHRIAFAFAFALVSLHVAAQDSFDRVQSYIDRYKDIAMAEMQRSGVPASITLAQGILESGYGESELATKANNHFGIKCHTGWEGKTITYDDDAKGECFRSYESAEESFRDHSDFLRTRERYAFLFDYHPTDYKKWAYGLKQAGYATNPKYPELLISSIEKYNLGQYDVYETFAADNVTKPSTDPEKPKHERTKEKKSVDGFFAFVGNLIPGKKTPAAGGSVFYVNGVKAVRLKDNQTLEAVGRQYGIGVERLLKYNDLNDVQHLPAGTLVYVQQKRRVGDSLYHVVRANETMYGISQQHGIRLQNLYEKNNMERGTQPAAGEVIYLVDKRSTVPVLRGQEPKPVAPEPSKSLASVGARPAPAPASDDASPKYAKPMPTDPLFSNGEKVNASMDASQHTEPVNATPNDATYTANDIEASAEYITSTEVEGVDYYTVKPKDTLYSIARAYGLSVDKLMEINQLGSNVISSGMRLRVKP